MPPPRPAQQPVALFGEFRFVGNGEVRATAASGALPPVIAAPLGTIPSGMAFVEKEVLREDDASAPNGVGFLYYEGEWDVLPDFNSLRPLKTGTADNFTLSVRQRDERFALLFNGHVNIPATGTYTFYTTSDDGSRLWIGSKLVVNNDGLHGAQERSGAIELTPGRHEITVAFFQKLGGLVLEVRYEGPGLSKQLIPNNGLFRSDALYLYQAGNFRPALNRTPGRFALPYAHQDEAVNDRRALFYEDTARTFFVEPARPVTPAAEIIESDSTYLYTFSSVSPREAVAVPADQRWRFRTFYHPYVSACIRELNRHGVPGLFNRSLQTAPHTLAPSGQPLNFLNDYQPVPTTVAADGGAVPVDEVDVSAGGAYSLYNWELFFHAPLMIADRLSHNQRFEEAQQWLHYIFDPTDRSGGPTPDRFWRFKRFQGVAQESIQELLEALASGQRETELRNQVKQWRDHPFNAHLIARLRLPAYQRAVVMKYIDNLIAWGDQHFRRDTVESINDATLLYVFAAELLGPRPQTIGARGGSAPRTFAELDAAQDDFLVRIETLLPPDTGGASDADIQTPELLTAPYYFCIPKNEALLRYWDTVADRLFKIRHCQNIEGVARQLPLFEPPLDPGLLVRAAAAGVDIGSSLNDVNAPLPHYRFRVMAQKAAELCSDLKALGSSLLSALEKRDAEATALLRSGHELRLLAAVRRIKERQVEEAREAVEVLRKARQLADLRFEYYDNAEFMNQWERAHLALTGTSAVLQAVAQLIRLSSAGAKAVPDVEVGVAGWAASPFATVKYGGTTIGGALEGFGDALSMLASLAGAAASM
ncbi:MAG TPA: PA14 domain-containing protein, partial [Caulobacteraceae bacterium]|nr:PA14 domain-containing protein [Caulobacteraceae bacterium]